MAKYTKVNGACWSDRRETAAVFDHYSFDEVRFLRCAFSECRWQHTRFFRIGFSDTTFTGCTFEETRFAGQHSYLGPATFDQCIFRGCDFADVQPWQATFSRCQFPGTALRNITFHGDGRNRTLLRDVDLRESTFTFTSFRGGVDLSSVRLPHVGIRIFANRGGALTQALLVASGVDEKILDPVARLTACPRRALFLLAGGIPPDLRQDPLVFDADFLEAMLERLDERELFERLAGPLEIET